MWKTCGVKMLHDWIIPRGDIVLDDTVLARYADPMEAEPPADKALYSEDGVDLTMIRWMLSLTPAERLEVLQSTVNSILDIRERNVKT
jgi:hypothetical protein